MRKNYPNKIITHTAVSLKKHTVFDVDEWHKLRWPGFTSKVNKKPDTNIGWHVGYHVVIDWDGRITYTRDFLEEGAHCLGQNTSSIGVCFMGNGDVHLPSKAQLESWKKVYTKIKQVFPFIGSDDIYPHRRYAMRSCHGSKLPDYYYAEAVDESMKIDRLKATIRRLEQELNKLLVLVARKRMSKHEK